MRQLRQTLRLHLESGFSLRDCAQALGMPKSTVGEAVRMARVAGVDWAVAQSLSDEELEARLYRPPGLRPCQQLEPDHAFIHQELKRPGVTLQLLWEEYARGNDLAYRYTSICVKYRAWAASLKRSMRQPLAVIDAPTGENRHAQIFVAVLGALDRRVRQARLRLHTRTQVPMRICLNSSCVVTLLH